MPIYCCCALAACARALPSSLLRGYICPHTGHWLKYLNENGKIGIQNIVNQVATRTTENIDGCRQCVQLNGPFWVICFVIFLVPHIIIIAVNSSLSQLLAIYYSIFCRFVKPWAGAGATKFVPVQAVVFECQSKTTNHARCMVEKLPATAKTSHRTKTLKSVIREANPCLPR